MALIDYQKGHFYGLGTYDERAIFKSAGFWYSAIRKAWITERREIAERIQGIRWTERALAHVTQQDHLAVASYEMSYAKESGFAPIVPDKLHPRTGKQLAFFPYQAAAIEYALPRKDCLLADAPGIGKEQDINTPIYTPNGWRKIGELKVGDFVFSRDGKQTKVVGVFPQKTRENYEITFRDGVTTNSGPNHLWLVSNVDNRNRRIKQGKPEYEVLSLRQMLDRLFSRPGKGNRKGLRWYIPLCEPVEHPEADLPIDPYILGVLIGDGSLTHGDLSFANSDKGKAIREEVSRRLPQGLRLQVYTEGRACPQAHITSDNRGGLRSQWVKIIRALKLNVNSTNKFVPEIYKRASIQQRLDLLRGLMDTDGSCTANRTTFTTTSPYLATDIRELVQSLGGMGIRHFYDNRKSVTKRQRSMPEFHVNVKLHLCPFLLSYKAAQWKPFLHRRRYITKIERIADVEQVCIRVNNPSHLYLCEHFIVTHNTPTAVGVFNCDPKIKTVLIVCPASLKEHWRREFELWKARPVTVAIAEASFDEKVQDGFYKNGKPKFKTVTHKDVWPDADVVIINYEILERFQDDIKSRAWDMLVCDECHALKTSDSGRTLFVLGGRRKETIENEDGKKRKGWKWYSAIDASRRLFLSGTPILNRPYELWPIVHAFDPDGLGRSEEAFCYRYCGAFWDAGRGSFGALDKSGASNEEELGRMLRERMMIRRLKKEVLPELPQKSRHVILIDTPETRKWVAREDEIAQALKLYETSILRNGMNEFELEQAKGDQIVHAAAALDIRDAFEADGKFETHAMKLDYAASVLGLEPPYVAILFEELAQVRRELGIAKLSGVIPWVKEFLNGSEEKLLLFAYHTDVIEALREKLKDYNPAVIYGKVPVNKRQLEVDKFQDDESCRGGIMQIDCAGVGFTMTRAWNVAFAEEDWVPKKKDQAEDRVCRIGQTAEKVMSFSLVVNGSLDCRIAQSSFFKDEAINKVMDT